MNCPSCAIPMLKAHRQEVEIDFCPKCHGIWLDEGEVDKLTPQPITHERRWYEFLNPETLPILGLKREKYSSWRLTRYWQNKFKILRRIQNAH